ncbi:biopolymer transporter ExbD [uncultured Maribacter sp.]|uniref:ExbD/TolR family protein n=1 Tax=uncultured Maribacter sp. TaxID=431308 RepID=UPI0026137364|nr:biopolymer transporter ExbD [uncultured Maribacter sp.]
MSKFKKNNVAKSQEISTASLPDIVFMLLFFFMTVTVMKEEALKVENILPSATEIKKMEHKDRIVYIYVGKPTQNYVHIVGEEPKIQLNDKLANVSDVGPFVLAEIAKKPSHLRGFVTVALKVDKKANMGLISDIKQELRKVNALKINYITYEGEEIAN